jgi:hypothetical protein
MRHPAINEDSQGQPIIDMEMIKKMVDAYEQGDRSMDMMLAKIILSAYVYGFRCGVEATNDAHMNTQMLLMHTAGNA